MLKMNLLVLASAALFSHASIAEEKVNVIAKKQPDSELSVLGFTIGKSKIDEVQAKFKSKDVFHAADAASVTKILCYKSSNGSTVAFEADSKSGPNNIITAISINSSASPYRLNNICEKTALINAKLVLNGVSLGMSSDLIKRVKGKPSTQSNELITYKFEVKEGETKIISNFNIKLNQNAVSSIMASKF